MLNIINRQIRKTCQTFLEFRRSYLRASLVKTLPTYKALKHFDDYYGSVYKTRWPSIRLALLSKRKQCALLNQFSNIEAITKRFEALGAFDMKHHTSEPVEKTVREKSSEDKSNQISFYHGNSESNSEEELDPSSRFSLDTFVPVNQMKYQEEIVDEADYYRFYKAKDKNAIKIIPDNSFITPPQWKVMCFPRGDISNVPAPAKDNLGLYSHYALDAASLLSVAALNLQKGDTVVDLCAGNGDRVLASLLSMLPASVLVNDRKPSKVSHIINVVNNYIPDYLFSQIKLDYLQTDCRLIKNQEKQFSKILLSVPCTNDRKSVTSDEGNYFGKMHVKNRNELPHYLKDMLTVALETLKPNGTLVYSTENLSPVLNDGVVQGTLYDAAERGMHFQINDIKDAVKSMSYHFRFDLSFKYGIVVLPFMLCNYGPTYMAKITRTE